MKEILFISLLTICIACQNRSQDQIFSNNVDSNTVKITVKSENYKTELLKIYGNWEKEKSFKGGTWEDNVDYYYSRSEVDTLNNNIQLLISEDYVAISGKCKSRFKLNKDILSVYGRNDGEHVEEIFLKEFGIDLNDSIYIINDIDCPSPFNKIYIFPDRLLVREYGAYYTSLKKTNTKNNNCVNPSTTIQLPFSSSELNKYNQPFEKTNCIQGNVNDFFCGEDYLRYIPVFNNDSLDIIIVPMDCGDFNLYQILILKNNYLISNMQVDGKWYEIGKEDDYTLTKFTLDNNLKLNVIIEKYQKNEITTSKSQKYLIDTNGLIIKE